MFRNDDPTALAAAPAVPAPTGSSPGFFTNGNPAAGTPATIVPDWWLTQLQEEPLAVLAAAGIVPVKGTNNQLLAALVVLFQTPLPLPFQEGSPGAWSYIVPAGPPGVYKIRLRAIAPTGSGATATAHGDGGGGAGAGAGIELTALVTPGQVITGVNGTPGAQVSAAATAGNAGTASSITIGGLTITLPPGGPGGISPAAGQGGAGGAGGMPTATGSYPNLLYLPFAGGDGEDGTGAVTGSETGNGGAGGVGMFGGSGRGGAEGGQTTNNWGAGPGGGYSTAGNSSPIGGPPLVIIEPLR